MEHNLCMQGFQNTIGRPHLKRLHRYCQWEIPASFWYQRQTTCAQNQNAIFHPFYGGVILKNVALLKEAFKYKLDFNPNSSIIQFNNNPYKDDLGKLCKQYTFVM